MRQLQIALVAGSLVLATPSFACTNTGDFGQWLQNFKAEAASAGIKPLVIDESFSGVKLDQSVLASDRAQHNFALDFLAFSSKKVVPYRITQGRALLNSNAGLFKRIEQTYGVPGEVLTAFWGLETDFGQVMGNTPTIQALTTLAYDCRRPELFRGELMSALRLVQKGDQTPNKMKGAWAGELGQLQFIPSKYDEFGVDFDGDGKRDVIKSKADALASAAHMLQNAGWKAGEPWLREVRVPKEMDWAQARIGNRLPIAEWGRMGVMTPNGSPVKGGGVAALLLPMGRNGPTFLAYPNFDAILEWNESTVYSTTAAYFANRLAGAPAIHAGNAPVKSLSKAETASLQSKLRAKGFTITKVDGIIGNETRDAVRKVQQELGLPADGYPDQTLLSRL